MICHQTIGTDTNTVFRTSFLDRPKINEVIRIFMKHWVFSDTPLPDMMCVPWHDAAKRFRHGFWMGKGKGGLSVLLRPLTIQFVIPEQEVGFSGRVFDPADFADA